MINSRSKAIQKPSKSHTLGKLVAIDDGPAVKQDDLMHDESPTTPNQVLTEAEAQVTTEIEPASLKTDHRTAA